METENNSNRLLQRSTLLATLLNTMVAIFFRGITFILNAFILRKISGDVLGIVNVRLLLIFDTIIFISREAFRKSCLKKPENGDWRGTINVIWMCWPIGIFFSLVLGYIWSFHLELPKDLELHDQYHLAVILMCLSAMVELSFESCFVISQIFLWIKFRAFVDTVALGTRAFMLALIVSYKPEKTILYFGWTHLLASVIQLLLYILKFSYELQKSSTELQPALSSVRDLFPSSPFKNWHQDRWNLTKSFIRQGILKQLLTEGEKYLFTIFSLMTLAEQGIYDVVANLGSLAPRLVFSKVEESAYLYFNQSVVRGENVNPQVAKKLKLYLRAMSLFGLTVLCFGFSYSHLLLHIYGGTNLSQGLGPSLLRGHCFFVFVMALNGVSECFSFAIMTSQQVNQYNYIMSGMTVIFLVCAWIFSKVFGPVGFIMANCCNFAMRIIHSCYVIHKHNGSEALKGLLPTVTTFLCLISSGIICNLSENFIYDPNQLEKIGLHLIIGGLFFVITIVVMFFSEKDIVNFVRNKEHAE